MSIYSLALVTADANATLLGSTPTYILNFRFVYFISFVIFLHHIYKIERIKLMDHITILFDPIK